MVEGVCWGMRKCVAWLEAFDTQTERKFFAQEASAEQEPIDPYMTRSLRILDTLSIRHDLSTTVDLKHPPTFLSHTIST